MVKEITIKLLVTLKEFNMKEKLKELLSIPTKTWEEERLINYLIGHFEEKGYLYEVDDMGNLYVTKGISEHYPLVLAHTDSVHEIEEMVVKEEYLPNSQGDDTMSLSLMGVKLFEEESEFFNKTRNIILEHGFTEWRHHPYTDTMVLKERFNFACLNFAAGYYNYHTRNEYVVVEDVKNSINLGENVIKELGNSFYEFKSSEKESDFWFH